MSKSSASQGFRFRFHKFLESIEYNKKDNFYYIVLLSAPVLLTLYRYYAEAQDFLAYFPKLQESLNGEVYAYALEYLSFFVLFLVVPYLLLKYYGQDDILKSFTGMPKISRSMRWLLIILLIYFIYSAYSASSMESILMEYPLPRSLLSDQSMLGFYFLAYLLLYYLPWEFFFRGFLLFGLKSKYGIVTAVLIQTISSCLVHIDKPAVEILGSIPFGIVFGIIAIRTRSIWILVLLHALLGILTDVFIIF